jgi:tetratricopeptide (TPR) repeat protein
LSDSFVTISRAARSAAQAKDWTIVESCAAEIIRRGENDAEGYFLLGLASKASGRHVNAVAAFGKAVGIDEKRHDASVELAELLLPAQRFSEAVALLQAVATEMRNSPRYLQKAATIYVKVGMPDRAWPLYQRAAELQPGVDSLLADFAACSVFVGKIDLAKSVYRDLLQRHPAHQRNHFELSRLETATDAAHVDQMEALLQTPGSRPEMNIYLYYALGKELEDLGRWSESFAYYKRAGDAVARMSRYNVQSDIDLMESISSVCDSEWMTDSAANKVSARPEKIPAFIVGLPRSGSTLTERILSRHSGIESIGETYFLQTTIKQSVGDPHARDMSPAIIEAAAAMDAGQIATHYLNAVSYRFGDKRMFIEKFPENFLYLGFIAKAFPQAPIIFVHRNPMDNCFALYKQSFFRYAYSLDDLARFYVAYDRLRRHWASTLGDRIINVQYEDLVQRREYHIRRLLDGLDLAFEADCLYPEKNPAASNTASTVQIRERIHSRSVNRWKHFEVHLQPLCRYLTAAGIDLDPRPVTSSSSQTL